MSKGKTVYVTKELIEDFESEELDFNIETEFGIDEDDYTSVLVEIQPKYGSADGNPIRIERFIEILENFKAKGTTHVEISYHGDHRSYEITALKIRLSTQEEIDAHVEKITKQSDKQKKIAELEEQIKQIKKG